MQEYRSMLEMCIISIMTIDNNACKQKCDKIKCADQSNSNMIFQMLYNETFYGLVQERDERNWIWNDQEDA